MIWATVSSKYCFYWLYRASPSVAAENMINLILILTIWLCPCIKLSLGCWKRVFAMTSVLSVCSLDKTLLAFPLLHFVSQGQTFLLLQISLDFLLFHSNHLLKKRTSFGGVSPRSLVGLHRNVQLQLLQRQWLGHRLGLLWCWMVCLGNEPRSFCRFLDCTQVVHFRLFCWGLLNVFLGILGYSSR